MGYPHPDELLRKLTSRQVAEWIGYESLEPFGERNRDWHFGKLASIIVGVNQEAGSKLIPPENFTKPNRLDYEIEKERQQRQRKLAPKAIKEIFKAIRDEAKEAEK